MLKTISIIIFILFFFLLFINSIKENDDDKFRSFDNGKAVWHD